MKKIICLASALIVLLIPAGCSAPAEDAPAATIEPTQEHTADELRALIGQYEIDGDYESVYETASF